MKLVISDIHFGDKKACDLLRYQWAQDKLFQALEECDQIILLGDIWDFTFCSFLEAIKVSEPFFRRLGQTMPHLKVTVTAGNHDHHLVLRANDEAKENQALYGIETPSFTLPPAERILRAFMPHNKIESFYPFWSDKDIWYHHGHYISSHLEMFGWQVLDRLQWRVIGQKRNKNAKLLVEEYEALIAPLHELSYQVAQLSKGSESQKQIVSQMKKFGDIFQGTSNIVSLLPAKIIKKNELDKDAEEVLQSVVNQTEQFANNKIDTEAIKKVLLNLEVKQPKVIFGHTHRANGGEDITEENQTWQVYNAGSWIYDNKLFKHTKNSLPGSVLLIDEFSNVNIKQLLDLQQIENFSAEYSKNKT